MRTAAFAMVVLLVTGVFVTRARGGHDGNYTDTRSAVIDAGGARQVRVESSAGDLRVVGVEGAGEVRVQGTAHASRRGLLKNIRIQLVNKDGVVTVRATMPKRTGFWFGRSPRRSMDLVVQVPGALEVDVADGTGDADVRGVGALRIVDGSGDLRVSDVHGPVRVTDGSGELTLDRVGGDVWIEDGSGEVGVHDVQGTVVIAGDGSGQLGVRKVQGDVIVQRDASGDIDVTDVGGAFTVQQDGSGELRYANVRGEVQVPTKRTHASR